MARASHAAAIPLWLENLSWLSDSLIPMRVDPGQPRTQINCNQGDIFDVDAVFRAIILAVSSNNSEPQHSLLQLTGTCSPNLAEGHRNRGRPPAYL